MLFLSSADFQYCFNEAINRPTPNMNATESKDSLVSKANEILRASPGGIQYFDRDTPIELASKTPAIFVGFMSHRDVDKTAEELERLRLEVFAGD